MGGGGAGGGARQGAWLTSLKIDLKYVILTPHVSEDECPAHLSPSRGRDDSMRRVHPRKMPPSILQSALASPLLRRSAALLRLPPPLVPGPSSSVTERKETAREEKRCASVSSPGRNGRAVRRSARGRGHSSYTLVKCTPLLLADMRKYHFYVPIFVNGHIHIP